MSAPAWPDGLVSIAMTPAQLVTMVTNAWSPAGVKTEETVTASPESVAVHLGSW